MKHRSTPHPPQQRRGAMLIAALATVAILGAAVVVMLMNVGHQIRRTRQLRDRSQTELAATAVATAPTTVTTLSLPSDQTITIANDRVTLSNAAGRQTFAVALPERKPPTPEESNAE